MVTGMEVEHGPATENIELANDEETQESRRCPNINIKLLPYKCFYFLFFSAVGSLFPYLAIFYKQMWLSAQKTGILIGMQPLLQLASNSVWGMIADRSGKSKIIFFAALIAWLCSNFSLSLVKNPLNFGPCNENRTRLHPKGDTLRLNTETTERNNTSNTRTAVKTMIYFEENKKERMLDELSALGHSPWPLEAITNFENGSEAARSQHKEDDGTFFLLLLITVVGNLVASPAVPFADSATLQALGK